MIMQQMIEQKKSCYLNNENGNMFVITRPQTIADNLKNKLTEEDIEIGCQSVNLLRKHQQLKTALYQGCNNTSCKNKSCLLKGIPCGNIKSDIMLLNKMPSEYDVCNFSSHTDEIGVFLSVILKRMQIDINSLYMTDLIKCHVENLDKHSYDECISQYFLKEMDIVSPKLIICNGLPLLKALDFNKIIKDLPQNLSYGNIYDVTDKNGRQLKITAIYELSKVLQKEGDDYTNCKLALWNQILNAFQSIYT